MTPTTLPLRQVERLRPQGRALITPSDPEFAACGFVRLTRTTLATYGWAQANTCILIPFTLNRAVTVYALYIRGTANSGNNFDLGIYTNNFERLVSTGSTVYTTSASWQRVTITATNIPAGRLYFALNRNNTGASQNAGYGAAVSVSTLAALGCLQKAATFPLPDPISAPSLNTLFTRVPAIGFSTRPTVP